MIGRFQPFHLGHLALTKQILDECKDGLIIAITSSQFNYIQKDPFTAGERIEMIHRALVESHLDMSLCFVTAIENQFNVATWSGYLKAALPKFDLIYSGNSYVTMLLSDFGVNVVEPVFIDRTRYNATAIRHMIATGKDEWQDMVPNSVCQFLKEINAKRRLSIIYDSDTRPTEH